MVADDQPQWEVFESNSFSTCYLLWQWELVYFRSRYIVDRYVVAAVVYETTCIYAEREQLPFRHCFLAGTTNFCFAMQASHSIYQSDLKMDLVKKWRMKQLLLLLPEIIWQTYEESLRGDR